MKNRLIAIGAGVVYYGVIVLWNIALVFGLAATYYGIWQPTPQWFATGATTLLLCLLIFMLNATL